MTKLTLRCHLKTIERLLDSLDTCHQCKGILTVDDTPTYCEEGGCSWDCDEHDGPECTPRSELQRRARVSVRELKKLSEATR